MGKKKHRSYPGGKQQKMKDLAKDMGCGQCLVCEQPLYKKGGYAETGMCGPCATGEAATIDELGDGW